MEQLLANNNTNFADALEDVHIRFILNLPTSELETPDRILFQLEQAWWFYEDLLCDPAPEKNLPRFPKFSQFAKLMFEYSDVLPDVTEFPQYWNSFSLYKRKISNYGCILLNTSKTKVILCQVWNSKSITFPAGKINQNESGIEAAARETYEETGFDPSCQRGLTNEWKQNDDDNTDSSAVAARKVTWKTSFGEAEMLVHQEENGGKRRTYYVVSDVPEDFPFAPVARKEVSKVSWYDLDKIPKHSFGVLPFVGPLKRWIKKRNKNRDKSRDKSRGKNKSSGRASRGRSSRGRSSRGRTSRERAVIESENDDLVSSGLASAGDTSGWSEEDMFLTNAKILGRNVPSYDGNPHVFCDEGLTKADPHAFRVVGGGFLNSQVNSLAPPPERSRLQPLFRPEETSSASAAKANSNENNDDGLTPFFSTDGATPWGEVVQEAKVHGGELAPNTSSSDKSKKKKSGKKNKPQRMEGSDDLGGGGGDDGDGVFLTDAQITQKSQATKKGEEDPYRASYERDMAFVRQWVANLPKPVPTKHFGVFRLDADAIVAKAMAEAAGKQQT